MYLCHLANFRPESNLLPGPTAFRQDLFTKSCRSVPQVSFMIYRQFASPCSGNGHVLFQNIYFENSHPVLCLDNWHIYCPFTYASYFFFAFRMAFLVLDLSLFESLGPISWARWVGRNCWHRRRQTGFVNHCGLFLPDIGPCRLGSRKSINALLSSTRGILQ